MSFDCHSISSFYSFFDLSIHSNFIKTNVSNCVNSVIKVINRFVQIFAVFVLREVVDRKNQRRNLEGTLSAVKDFEYEYQMALMNKSLYPEVETVFFMPSERFTYVNSSIVREVARLGGDITQHVPPVVAQVFADKFSSGKPPRDR